MQRDTENIESRTKIVAKMYNLSTSPEKNKQTLLKRLSGHRWSSLELATHQVFHGEENKRTESNFDERYKSPRTAQGQT
jgi:hypothetical protein